MWVIVLGIAEINYESIQERIMNSAWLIYMGQLFKEGFQEEESEN